jgi:hypothetical protein
MHNMTNILRPALKEAFAKGFALAGSYLDNLGSYHMATLEVAWESYGEGTDSLLSFAEKIRKGK